jgi:hypothetical protein
MVVLVKLGEAVKAAPAFTCKDKAAVLRHGEEIDLLDWDRRGLGSNGNKTGDLRRHDNTNARAGAFTT